MSKHEEAGKCERKLRTGAETDTYLKDGESIRSSKLSADLAKRTRKWLTEKSSGRTRRCTLHWCLRNSKPQKETKAREETGRRKRRKAKSGVPGGPEPRTYAQDQQLLAARSRWSMRLKHLITATATDCRSLHR